MDKGANERVCVATDAVCGFGISDISFTFSADSFRDNPVPSPELGRLLLAGDDVLPSPGPSDERLPSPTSVVIKLSSSCRSLARVRVDGAGFEH